MRANKLKNGRVKHILTHAKKAVNNSAVPDFVWLYYEGVSDPPVSLLRVQIELVTNSVQENYSSGPASSSAPEYTAEEVEKIINTISFGKNLSASEMELL